MQPLLKYWLPVLVWLCLIFIGSTDLMSAEQTSRIIRPLLRWLRPAISMETIAQVQFVVRKCAHLTEYAILAILLWRAIYRGMKMSPNPAKPGSSFGTKPVINTSVQTEGAGRSSLVDSTGCLWVRSRSILAVSVWVMATLVAATDEFHQSFVLSRTASVIDVMIDSIGAIFGLLVISRWRRPRDG
jgi:VanZ family protein